MTTRTGAQPVAHLPRKAVPRWLCIATLTVRLFAAAVLLACAAAQSIAHIDVTTHR